MKRRRTPILLQVGCFSVFRVSGMGGRCICRLVCLWSSPGYPSSSLLRWFQVLLFPLLTKVSVPSLHRQDVPPGHLVPGLGQHLQLRLGCCPQGGGADSRGDMGRVLHHPRLRRPGGVRRHSQDYPGLIWSVNPFNEACLCIIRIWRDTNQARQGKIIKRRCTQVRMFSPCNCEPQVLTSELAQDTFYFYQSLYRQVGKSLSIYRWKFFFKWESFIYYWKDLEEVVRKHSVEEETPAAGNKPNLTKRVMKVWRMSRLNIFSMILNQIEKSRRLQEKVDRIALLLFPLIFLVFNLIYWPYYLQHVQNRI